MWRTHPLGKHSHLRWRVWTRIDKGDNLFSVSALAALQKEGENNNEIMNWNLQKGSHVRNRVESWYFIEGNGKTSGRGQKVKKLVAVSST